jgi:hypothetical protein
VPPSPIHARLAALPARPSADDLAPIADELARACRSRAQPRKSLALHLRNAKGAASPAVLRAVADLVVESLDRTAGSPVAISPVVNGAWIDVSEAARILGLQRPTLTDRLKLPEYRLLYGWPFWDGHQWWFSSVALAPDTRVEFLARMPKQEPAAHVVILPPWCVRQAGAELSGDSAEA